VQILVKHITIEDILKTRVLRLVGLDSCFLFDKNTSHFSQPSKIFLVVDSGHWPGQDLNGLSILHHAASQGNAWAIEAANCNFAAEKMDGWNTDFRFGAWPIFRAY